jgi:hypothetical protein
MQISSVTPCFTSGTRIATDRGLHLVERLKRGMRVVTRDNGLARVEWVGRRTVSYDELEIDTELRPILIQAHALGEGRPTRDMLVSPSHRFLIGPEQAFLNLLEDEALVAARHLVDHWHIRPAEMLGVSYIHILCDQHQVIMADGAWTETFHPDDQTMRGLGNSQRRELIELFPDIETIGASRRFPAARPVLGQGFTRGFRG